MLYHDSKKESSMKPTTAYLRSKPLNIARKKWRKTDENKHNKGCKRYIAEMLYGLSNTVYVAFYFYFSPFLVTIYPIMSHGFTKNKYV